MQIANAPRDWENPGVFSRNKCRSHAPLRAHPSQDSALQYFVNGPNLADNANIISLNGSDWSFELFEQPEKVPQGFHDVDFSDGDWKQVRLICPLY